jgi:hypothetical protein
MFSLEEGLPVAKIKGGADDGTIIHLKKPSLRVSATRLIVKNKKESDDSVEVEDNDSGMLHPIANENHHEILYVCGPAGSGKSTYIGDYVKSYKKVFPKKRIVVISGVEKDKPLDDLGVFRYDVNDESILDDPLTVDDFRGENYGSLVIFDDFDSINNKKIRTEVFDFMERLIKTCRIHTDEKLTTKERRNLDIDVVITGHQIFNYKSTREIINELTSITVFPLAGNSYQITQFLKRYMGFDNDNINRVYKVGEMSRWVTIFRQFPQWVLYEKGCYLLKRKEKKTAKRLQP